MKNESAPFARLPDQTSRRLRCSVHGCFLVLHRTVINTPRRGKRTLELFICPIEGCDTRRANKWQGGALRSRIAERINGTITKLTELVDEAMRRDRQQRS